MNDKISPQKQLYSLQKVIIQIGSKGGPSGDPGAGQPVVAHLQLRIKPDVVKIPLCPCGLYGIDHIKAVQNRGI